jgi:putative flippase GtrA
MSTPVIHDVVSVPRPPRRSLIARLVACMSVSVITTSLSLTVLAVLTAGFSVKAWVANVIATAVATVPSYRLNRRWVWRKHVASDPLREVLPFWMLAAAGLILSTIAVAAADSWARSEHLTKNTRTFALLFANLAAFGSLWIIQFVILDRVLFKHHPHELPKES